MPMIELLTIFCICLCALGIASCASSDNTGQARSVSIDPLYFDSPQQAVQQAADLLHAKDWSTLARYYDLSQSDVTRDELVSGEFYYRADIGGPQHPAGPDRYRHPYAPGCRFSRVVPSKPQGLVKVIVEIEIDQGDGFDYDGHWSDPMRWFNNRVPALTEKINQGIAKNRDRRERHVDNEKSAPQPSFFAQYHGCASSIRPYLRGVRDRRQKRSQ